MINILVTIKVKVDFYEFCLHIKLHEFLFAVSRCFSIQYMLVLAICQIWVLSFSVIRSIDRELNLILAFGSYGVSFCKFS